MPNIGTGAFDDKHKDGHWNSLIGGIQEFLKDSDTTCAIKTAKQLHPNISSKQNPVAKSIWG